MILLLAVAAGVLAGWARAWVWDKPYQPHLPRHLWLVFFAVIPQFLAFFLPNTRDVIPDSLAAVSLFISQGLLLLWVALNLKIPFLWITGTGLLLNILVIFLNGGFMPVSQETVLELWPGTPPEAVQTGSRLGNTKDIVLNEEDINLPLLADHIITPPILSSRYAFSIGDVLLSLGIFGMLLAVDGQQKHHILSFISHS